jgi:hypothetical protein
MAVAQELTIPWRTRTNWGNILQSSETLAFSIKLGNLLKILVFQCFQKCGAIWIIVFSSTLQYLMKHCRRECEIWNGYRVETHISKGSVKLQIEGLF